MTTTKKFHMTNSLDIVSGNITTENVADRVAYTQNGREVTFKEVTFEDLIVDAIRYHSAAARAELSRRGIDWTQYR